jgi:hypothetical protein
MRKKEKRKKVENPRVYGKKKKKFLPPYPSALGQFQPHGCM